MKALLTSDFLSATTEAKSRQNCEELVTTGIPQRKAKTGQIHRLKGLIERDKVSALLDFNFTSSAELRVCHTAFEC